MVQCIRDINRHRERERERERESRHALENLTSAEGNS
jgi:hypothetical protein